MSILKKDQKKHFLLLIVFLLASVNAFNQVKNLGIPYFQNYTVDDYKAAKQIWAAAQDKRGVLYFGNYKSVIEFDGHDWNSIKLPNKTGHVRAVSADSNGRVYVGTKGDFGYLAPDSVGKMKYISLIEKIEENIDLSFGIDRIFIVNEKIYYTGENYLFEYSNDSITTYFIENLKQSVATSKHIFIRIAGKGLFEFVNGATKELPNKENHKELNIRAALPYGEDIIFVTMEDGLLLYDNLSTEEFKLPISDFLMKNKVISAILLNSGEYAFGLLSNGVIITSRDGAVLQHFDTRLGLQSDLVLNMLQSQDNNLWLCTGNGITNLITSLPLTKFGKLYTLNAATYSSVSNNDKLYIANSGGVYYKDWNRDEKHLNHIETFRRIGEPTNAWNFILAKGALLLATGRGVSEIKNNKIHRLKMEPIAVWDFLQMNDNRNLVVVGTNNGLKLLEFKEKTIPKWKKKKKKFDGDWVFKKSIIGFNEVCRHIEIDDQNSIWVSNQSKGIFKLIPDENFDTVVVKSYSENKGITDPINSYIFKLKDKIVVSTNNGLFYYDPDEDAFVPHEELNLLVGKDVKMWLMIEDYQGNIWYKQQRKSKSSGEDVFEMGQLILQDNGSYLNYKTPFYKFKNDIYSINPLENGNVIIGTSKGFIHYDPKIDKDYSKSYNALIRKVEFIANDSLIFDGAFLDSAGLVGLVQKETQTYKFPYQFNDIRFTFSAPFFDTPAQTLYKFYLEGNDDSWTDWKTKNFKEYSNLSEGEYTFRVKAKNIYEIESEEAVYHFTILPPWYRTAWAIAGYFVLAILLIWGIVRLSVRRLRKQKEYLEEVVQERTAEIRMKNTELEQQKEEILAQSEELAVQRDKLTETNEQLEVKNKTIEEKNKNITASITYAKRIQEAMLPLTDKIEQSFDDYFILFKPRDIVSGDFYWFAQKNNKTIFTAVDCTGHGVPGAFMSMIGSEILTTIVNQGITIPSEILDYKNRYVRKALKQEQTDNQDGMDMSLCTINKQNKIVEWAGAKNPLVYIRNKELFHVKGDSQSIGGHQIVKKKRTDFSNHEISYAEAPTYFYIFTDGFQDQFGGPKNRKFMVKRMKELIYDNHQKPMKEQQKILNIAIESWMKDVEQTDDILVIGFKLLP